MIDRNELHALADGELGDAERQALLARLGKDPDAEAAYQSILSIKSALRSCPESLEDTESLWSSCKERLDEIDRTKRVEGFVGRYAWGICGAFFLAIMVGGFFNRAGIRSVRPDEVPSYVAGLSPIAVSRNQNQAALDPVLKQVVGETFKNRPEKMAITAVGQNPVAGRRSSFVQLSDAFGDVALVALHDVQRVEGLWDYEGDPNYKCSQFDGVNALLWTRSDGDICMAIGRRSYRELHAIVTSMCLEAR